jgi:hypothetical protein
MPNLQRYLVEVDFRALTPIEQAIKLVNDKLLQQDCAIYRDFNSSADSKLRQKREISGKTEGHLILLKKKNLLS